MEARPCTPRRATGRHASPAPPPPAAGTPACTAPSALPAGRPTLALHGRPRSLSSMQAAPAGGRPCSVAAGADGLCCNRSVAARSAPRGGRRRQQGRARAGRGGLAIPARDRRRKRQLAQVGADIWGDCGKAQPRHDRAGAARPHGALACGTGLSLFLPAHYGRGAGAKPPPPRRPAAAPPPDAASAECRPAAPPSTFRPRRRPARCALRIYTSGTCGRPRT